VLMDMTNATTLGFLVALGAGVAIGLQGLFTNITGQMLGPVRGALAIHITGTLVGAVMVFFLLITNPNIEPMQLNGRSVLFATLAGTCGMFIIMGIAFAFSRIGQVAGQGVLIFAQMGVAVFVDTLALAGGDPLPLDWRRLLGLALLGVGAYLLLPSN
ncbi:MAG: DMT family transporter, partial [Chloroflexota bacterium]